MQGTEDLVEETEDFVLPRRGRGRLSATGEAEYRRKVLIFCKKIREIDSPTGFQGQLQRLVLCPGK
jgi:hypothetical protein